MNSNLSNMQAKTPAKSLINSYWFYQAVIHGGYTATSHQMQVSAPTISRAVTQLERQLGEKLIHRNAKQFQLTQAGQHYFEQFSPIYRLFDDEFLQLTNTQNKLIGDIRVSCPEPFADYFLQPLAIEFMQQHPDINIHIEFSSDTQRFFDDKIDLAVVTSPAHAPALVQRKLFETPLMLAASPKYLEKQGTPLNIESLSQHDLIAGNTVPQWELEENGITHYIPLRPKYSVNSLRLSLQATIAGLGIARLPAINVNALTEQGVLEVVLPQVTCSTGIGYLVWADRKLTPTRVQVFKDEILEKIAEGEFLTSLTADN